MVRLKLGKVLEAVQDNASCHQKYLHVTTKIYTECPLEKFVDVFIHYFTKIVHKNVDKNDHFLLIVTFMAKFCAHIARKEESENHPFLSAIMKNILEFSKKALDNVRYNSCLFVKMTLDYVGEGVQLDNDLCDCIQEAMLQRMEDTKVAIVLQAVSTLCRLQSPMSPDCPVIAAYSKAMCDSNSNVRKEVVRVIAPTKATVHAIKGRIADVNATVRSVAYERCANIGPLKFRIVDRQMILISGFNETEPAVRKVFKENLLPKWFTAYNSDILKFIDGLKLTEWEDLIYMDFLSNHLFDHFFNTQPLTTLIDILHLSSDKLIPLDNLTVENALYWKMLVNKLRHMDDMDDYVNEVVPELTAFCKYVDCTIQARSKESVADSYELIDYDFQLWNLLDIMEQYDYSDEVGRKSTQSLMNSVLPSYEFRTALVKRIVGILEKCSSDINIFLTDMCLIISGMRETIVDAAPSQDDLRETNFRMAELKVKINILVNDQEEAIDNREFQRAELMETELLKIKAELEGLQQPTSVSGTKTITTNTTVEMTLRCLDILLAVLDSNNVTKLTPALVSIKDNFVIPLITCTDSEVHWRILRCLASLACIDKPAPKSLAKIIIIPVAAYHMVSACDVSALIQSISGVSDLLRLYGPEIFADDEAGQKPPDIQNATKRTLYSTDDDREDASLVAGRPDNMTFPYIIETLLNMLDDESEQVRIVTSQALTKIVLHDLPITPSVLSRIILKWYCTQTVKEDHEVQVMLGLLIEEYAKMGKSSVFSGAIVPTLACLINAPRTSPLADVDVHNVVDFFTAIMTTSSQTNDLRILALDLCMKIAENVQDRIVPHLTRLLLGLELSLADDESKQELIQRAEKVSEAIVDKKSRKHMDQFLVQLRTPVSANTNELTNTTATTTTINNDVSSTASHQNISRPLSPVIGGGNKQQVKRKKTPKNGMRRTTRLSETSSESILPTIVETSFEQMMKLDDPDAASVTSSNSKNSDRVGTVVSETSESDTSQSLRRSKRRRKKT